MENAATQDDVVNRPSHYVTAAGIEAIDVIEKYGLCESWHLGSAMKYLLRAGRKAGADRKTCLSKAAFYIDRFRKGEADGTFGWPAFGAYAAIDWHSPEEIIEAFGLTGTAQGRAIGYLLDVTCFENEDDNMDLARLALQEAILECTQ